VCYYNYRKREVDKMKKNTNTTKKNISEVKAIKVIEARPIPAQWFKAVNPMRGYAFTK